MKKFIKEFNANEVIEEHLLINKVTSGVTNAGSGYLTVTFQDKTGIIEGKIWDATDADRAVAVEGHVVQASADVILYRNTLQLRVRHMKELNKDDYNIADYVQTSKIKKDVLIEEIYAVIDGFENTIIKDIVSDLVKSHEQDFFEYPAATRNHHEYVGGLATHVLGMLSMANHLCDMHETINRDLLCAGVILHDMGKLQELSDSVMTEYTTKGKLLGHISIMQAEVLVTAEKLGYEEREETTLLRHMILSHHGQYEFGSPVLPMIAEAEYLKFLDNLDARVHMLDKALEPIDKGEFTPRIFSLENRSFYKPNLD